MPFRLRTVVHATAIAALIVAAPLRAQRPDTSAAQKATTASATLPAKLSAAEFWKLVSDVSEPGGFFRITDNYTSNENEVGRMFAMLRDSGKTGGVYLGVGPEQNLSYIAAIRPAMAFIIDIRRQAVMQHLMFKAMFEMARDRADFISLLFARPRPAGLDASTPIQRIWETYFAVPADPAFAEKTKARVIDQLTNTHRFTFTPDESWQLESVIDAFARFGPGITTRGGFGRGGGNNVSFADLTGWSTDQHGQPQSFLSAEEHFRTVKTLHEKHLIVPVSGDFGGPKALRAIGSYLRQRGATVTAFYVSNVEQYLFQDGKHLAFFENVATLPVTDAGVFIRPYALRRFGPGPALCGIAGFLNSVQAGRVTTNMDALACVQ